MPDKEYRIKIYTVAETSGIQQTTQALGETAGAQEEAGKAAERHGGHLHALHKVFHALNEVVPGLGIAMQAAFSPIGATISIAVMGLRAFHEKMKEVNAEFKKLEDEAAQPFTNRLGAMRDATVLARTELDALSDRLDRAARSEQTLKEQTEHAIAASHEQAEEAKGLAEAVKENDLAQLDVLHTAGLRSEEAYAKAKLDIELAYIAKKRELEETAEMTDILIRRRATEQAELNQPNLSKAAVAAEEKKITTLENLNSLRSKSDIETDKKKAEEALSEWDKKHGSDLAEAKANVDRDLKLGYGKPGASNEEIYGLNLGRARLQPLETERDKLQAAADAARKQWEQAPLAEARMKAAADSAAREAERAAKRAEDNAAYVTDSGRDLGMRRAQFDSRKKAGADIDALKMNSLQLGEISKTNSGGTAIGDVNEAVGTAQAIASHKMVSDQSKSELVQVASAIAGHTVNLATATEMMKTAGHNMNIFVNDVARLADVMDGMMSGSIRLSGKIDFLERQVQTLKNIDTSKFQLRSQPGSG